MTDEERQKLCVLLKRHCGDLGEEAADEIERLAARVKLLETELSAFIGENHD